MATALPNVKLMEFSKKRQDGSVWSIPVWQKNQKLEHSAASPSELVRRCLETTTEPGDHVLDPFFGSGTNGEVLLTHERHCTGIEVNKKYVDLSRVRLQNLHQPAPNEDKKIGREEEIGRRGESVEQAKRGWRRFRRWCPSRNAFGMGC